MVWPCDFLPGRLLRIPCLVAGLLIRRDGDTTKGTGGAVGSGLRRFRLWRRPSAGRRASAGTGSTLILLERQPWSVHGAPLPSLRQGVGDGDARLSWTSLAALANGTAGLPRPARRHDLPATPAPCMQIRVTSVHVSSVHQSGGPGTYIQW